MTWDDYYTVHHEIGHVLHLLLTQVDEEEVGGVNTPNDWVEVPSTFMEYWYWRKDYMLKNLKHVDTGLPIQEELIERIITKYGSFSGEPLLSQTRRSLIDLALHEGSSKTIEDIEREFFSSSGFPYHEWLSICSSFSHIFTWDYAANYYSYLASEAAAADIYSVFEDAIAAGDLSEVAERYTNTILALGNSLNLKDLYRMMVGRDVDMTKLLKYRGIT